MHIFNASLAVPTANDLRQAFRSTACGKVARCSRSGHHGIDWTLAPALFTSCFRCGSIRPPVKLGTPRSVPPSPVAKVLTRSKAEANRVANNSEAHSASGIALCTTVERKSKRLCGRGCGTAVRKASRRLYSASPLPTKPDLRRQHLVRTSTH